jgi:hypothetical protein
LASHLLYQRNNSLEMVLQPLMCTFLGVIEMKSLFLLGLVGLFSLGSVLEAEAGCRHRCGGRHHRRGCHSQCYTGGYAGGGCQVYGGGQMYGGQVYGNGAGVYADPNVGVGAGVDVGPAGAGAAVDANAVPAAPEPVK